MKMTYMTPAEKLVRTLKRVYDFGMTTTSGGNLSIKDDDGNIWITPSGIDKGTLRPSDVMKVAPDGTVTGPHRPSVELPFHSTVYRMRPDVRAVLHAHAPALVAFSLAGRMPNPKIIPDCEAICGKIAFARYEIPGSQELGDKIAAEFEQGAGSVIMENHGAVVCGANMEEAFQRFETLENLARFEIQSAGLGDVFGLANPVSKAFAVETFQSGRPSPKECELRGKMAEFAIRSYHQKLFFCGNSMIAARIKDGEFLITPAAFDPLQAESGDMVLIRGNKAEEGKKPSSATTLSTEIFARHSWVESIMMTRSENAMAYAAAHQVLDSRTIPESYIMLRDIPLISAEQYQNDLPGVIAMLKPSTPVLLIENIGILAVGKSVLEAFDRVEVCDFTAKCILLAQRIGKFAPINQKQVDDIIDVFKLPRD